MTASPSTRPSPGRRRAAGSRVEQVFRQGQRALRAHDLEHAVELLRQGVELDPGYARLRCWLARALAEAGRMDEADEAFAAATALRAERADLADRSRAVVPLERGLAWLDHGDVARARRHLDGSRLFSL